MRIVNLCVGGVLAVTSLAHGQPKEAGRTEKAKEPPERMHVRSGIFPGPIRNFDIAGEFVKRRVPAHLCVILINGMLR